MSTVYPILVTRQQHPYNPIGDVLLGTYRQGDSPASDRFDSLQPLSTYQTADERSPGWSAASTPLFRMDSMLIEKRPDQLGTVWTRDEMDDFVLGPSGELFYTSEGELFRQKKPGGRAQRVEVPAPLAGPLERSTTGLVLLTEQGLLRFDPDTGQGVELTRGAFEDFSLSADGRQVVYCRNGGIFLRDLDTHQDRTLLPPDGQMRFGPRLSPDQSRVFFGSWWIATDLSVRSRLQVMENRAGALPRTLLEQAVEAVPAA